MEIVPGGCLSQICYFVIFSRKSAFFKFADIFPECALRQGQSPQLEPLICLKEDHVCHVGSSCMNLLVNRINALFDEVVTGSNIILLYFKKRTQTGLGAAIFYRSGQEPRIITMNPYAWNKIKSRGAVFQFLPNQNFFLSGKAKTEEVNSPEKL